MRFCDFFISYKIGLKGIKNSIPFTQLPFISENRYHSYFCGGIIRNVIAVF